MVLMKTHPYLQKSLPAFEIFFCWEAQVTSREICNRQMALEQALLQVLVVSSRNPKELSTASVPPFPP
jgi:hypothetical protein